jgi:hypothetical protein
MFQINMLAIFCIVVFLILFTSLTKLEKLGNLKDIDWNR